MIDGYVIDRILRGVTTRPSEGFAAWTREPFSLGPHFPAATDGRLLVAFDTTPRVHALEYLPLDEARAVASRTFLAFGGLALGGYIALGKTSLRQLAAWAGPDALDRGDGCDLFSLQRPALVGPSVVDRGRLAAALWPLALASDGEASVAVLPSPCEDDDRVLVAGDGWRLCLRAMRPLQRPGDDTRPPLEPIR